MDNLAKLYLFGIYLLYFIASIIALFFIIKIYKKMRYKKNILNYKEARKNIKDFKQKYEKKYEFITLIFIAIWIVLTLYVDSIALMDLKNVLTENYVKEYCKVSRISKDKGITIRTISCANSTKKIVFSYLGDEIDKGTNVEVRYYKYIKVGSVYRVND